MSFIKDRLHFETSLYKTNTIDQTIPASISSTTGYRSAYINAGELETRGIESDLRLTPLLNLGNVQWNLTVNYSYTTSKVISIMEGLDELPIPNPSGSNAFADQSVSYAIVGEQFPTLKVTDMLRDPEGRVIVDQYTGYPTKNPSLVPYGHANPNHILGIVNNFSYKGLSLNIVDE